MIVLIAIFDFPAGSRERMLDLVRHMDAESNAELGCLHYRHAVDVTVENRIVLSEVWRDADALAAHFRSTHFRAFRAEARNLGLRSNVTQFEATEVGATHAEFWKTLLPERGESS